MKKFIMLVGFAMAGAISFAEDVGATQAPSNYVGIGSYSDYGLSKNPSEKSDYTGYWKLLGADQKTILLEGNYKDGIPVGVWRNFYENGNIHELMIFSGADQYQYSVFYPDGSLEISYRGTYSFANGKLNITILQQYAEFDTSAMNKLTGWSTCGVQFPSPASRGSRFDKEHDCYIFVYKWYKPNNVIEATIYIVENKYLGNVAKYTFSARLDPESGALCDIKTETMFGAGTLKVLENFIQHGTVVNPSTNRDNHTIVRYQKVDGSSADIKSKATAGKDIEKEPIRDKFIVTAIVRLPLSNAVPEVLSWDVAYRPSKKAQSANQGNAIDPINKK